MSHGKICYLEIPAITAEASAGFYSSIFGWTVRKRGEVSLRSTTQAALAEHG
jgi:uncharacterized protein